MKRWANARALTLALGAGLVAAAMMSAVPAAAVDIENRDKVPRDVLLNTEDGDSVQVTVKPHDRATGVCKSCVVLYGGTSVEASGNVTVKVEGGKVSLDRKR